MQQEQRRMERPLELSREEQLIAYFVKTCGRPVGKTRVMKLLYLADYESRRYLGRPISAIPYVWYHYGPYDKRFDSWLTTLKEHGVVTERDLTTVPGVQGSFYSPGKADLEYSFSPVELEILAYVRRTYANRRLRSLLDDIVYQTEPMKHAQAKDSWGKPLKMEMVDNAVGSQFRTPYEELLRRSRRALAGALIPHAEAMQRLRGPVAHATVA
jgi:hypothetical protein